MDLAKLIGKLKRELEMVDDVLLQLERVAATQGQRHLGPSGKLRKPFSEETKRRMALAQRRRWDTARRLKTVRP